MNQVELAIEPNKADTKKRQMSFGHARRVLKIQKTIIMSLETNGGHIQNACKKAGISRNTFYEWKERFDGFAEHVDGIIAGQVDMMESALYRNGLEGNVTAQIFYLKNKRPEEWQDVNKIDARLGVVDLSNAKKEVADVIKEFGLLGGS